MREILFRGKTSGNEWVCGNLTITGDCCFISEEMGFNRTVIPETVGQYTGLTDKNGKKIFEGDVIWFEDESPLNYEYHDCTEMRCGEIRYDDGQFYLTNRIAVEMEDLIYDRMLEGEVIGNIHDNPELLKGEQDNG